MNHEEYIYFLSLGICPQCRQVPIGRDEKACPECRARQTTAQLKRYKQNKEEILRKCKVIYKERKANNLCTVCGKNELYTGTMCYECSTKRKKYEKRKRKEKRYDKV